METDRILLSEGWLFRLDGGDGSDFPDESGFAPVAVPHDWQIRNQRDPGAPSGERQGGYPRMQRGLYRLDLDIPESWRGKRLRLLFDGVQSFSTVFCNGKNVGGRPYGYLPILCDLSDAVEYGVTNAIAVSADNRQNSGDRWYSGAGIYRPVWLLVDERSHIAHDGVAVTTRENRVVAVEASLELEPAFEGTLEITLLTPDGRTAAQCTYPASNLVQAEFAVDDALLWSPESPSLYRAELRLRRGEACIDSQTVAFGVRTAVFDGDRGFILNGKPTKLFGVDLHHDGGAFGAAMPPEMLSRRLRALKKIGCNAIRCSHNPQSEEFYDLCDSMGFLVIDELYDKWNGSDMYFDEFFDEWRFDDLRTMIMRDRNHPSVILWSVGNEVTIQFTEAFYRYAEELCGEARRLDPTRPVTLALMSFWLPEYTMALPLETKMELLLRYCAIVDVFMGNYMEPFYLELRSRGMGKAIIGSEIFTCYLSTDTDTGKVIFKSPFRVVKENGYVAGGFIWAGVDYLGESSHGFRSRGWAGSVIDSTGYPKLRAEYIAAQWKDRTEPMVRIAVYDENEPWDMANTNWGFPQMRRSWSYACPRKMMHGLVFSNCDRVVLTLNEGFPMELTGEDGGFEFWLAFEEGTLKARGYLDGCLAAEDVLISACEAERLSVACDKTVLRANGSDIAQLDILLVDKYGQVRPELPCEVTVTMTGEGELAALDSGDLTSDIDYTANTCRLYEGHAYAAVKAKKAAGKAVISAVAQGYDPVFVEIEIV